MLQYYTITRINFCARFQSKPTSKILKFSFGLVWFPLPKQSWKWRNFSVHEICSKQLFVQSPHQVACIYVNWLLFHIIHGLSDWWACRDCKWPIHNPGERVVRVLGDSLSASKARVVLIAVRKKKVDQWCLLFINFQRCFSSPLIHC